MANHIRFRRRECMNIVFTPICVSTQQRNQLWIHFSRNAFLYDEKSHACKYEFCLLIYVYARTRVLSRQLPALPISCSVSFSITFPCITIFYLYYTHNSIVLILFLCAFLSVSNLRSINSH